jgi:hypothetical protein
MTKIVDNSQYVKHVLAQPVVIAIGHIDGRWRKELVQPSSILDLQGSVHEA